MTVPRRKIHLAKFQERLPLFLDCGPDALVIVNKRGSIVHVNYQTERIFGYPREKLKGRSVDILLPAHLRDSHRRHRSEYLAAPHVRPMGIGHECCARRKDGSTFPAEITLSPIEIGNETFIISNIRDVSERKSLEKKLAELESRLRRVMAMVPSAVWTCKPSGNYACTFISDNIHEVLGYEPQYFLGDADFWGGHVHPDDLASALSQFRLLDQEPRSFEYRFLQPDGTYRWIHGEIRLIRDENGGPMEIVRSSIDISDRKLAEEALLASAITQTENITKRKQAEKALKDNARLLNAIFAGALDAIVVVDNSYHCLEANPAAGELFGLLLEQLIGRKMTEFAEPGHIDVLRNFLIGGKNRWRWNMVRPDGKRRMIDASVTSNVLPGRHLAILRDITEQQELEDHLRQAQKMEAIGGLAGGIAHDFNNLLTGILGYAEMVLKSSKESDSRRDHLQKVIDAALQARNLTGRLLAFGSQRAEPPHPVDINAEIKNSEDMLRRLIRENIEVHICLDSSSSLVLCERGSIQQFILNLATNAADAMPRGGKLLIRTSRVVVKSADPKFVGIPDGDYIVLEVSDTGCGMDSDVQRRMFEPFFTTKQPGRGTGLGLYTVYGIVQKSSGFIRVQSELGRGTTFEIILPVVNLSFSGERSLFEEISQGRGQLILVAEDDPRVRDLLRDELPLLGYQTVFLDNALDAAWQASKSDGKVDLLITDIVMPEINGIDLASKMKERHPSIKVLFITGYARDELLMLDSLAENVALLLKPFTIAELNAKISQLLCPGLVQ